MTGVYQKFISKYQVITEPLRRLKKKNAEFVWGPEQATAFKTLITSLCALPNLRQPDFSKQFELHCDAATTAGIAVILCQRQEGQPYPLAFASRSLNIHEQRYSVREIEALAIVWGIKKFRIYLERNLFLVFTDHSSLQWLLNSSQDKQPRLWRWVMFLQSYMIKIIYVKGKTHYAADLLSRSTNTNDQVNLITNFSGEDWASEQAKDESLQELKQEIDKTKDGKYRIQEGVLYKVMAKPRAFASSRLLTIVPGHLIPETVERYHQSEFAGQAGVKKTKALIRNSGHLWWSTMDADVSDFIKNCQLCQKIKGNKITNYPLSNTTADRPFTKIAIDYFGPLPKSQDGQYQYIFVIIDSFSRYVEIYPTKTTQSMEFASIFYHDFVLRHGAPLQIMCDNGPPLGAEFVRELAKFVDIAIEFTPPNHPSSNGLVERFMKTLRAMILTYVKQDEIVKQWDSKLRILRFTYNNLWHSSTRFAPFELVHGRLARTPLASINNHHQPKLYRNTPTPQSKFAKELQKDLEIAFEIVWRNKQVYDNETGNTTQEFQVGDKVLVYNNQLTKTNKPRKLSLDWYGPMVIVEALSKTRINLQDSKNKKLNNVHISMTKPFFEYSE